MGFSTLSHLPRVSKTLATAFLCRNGPYSKTVVTRPLQQQQQQPSLTQRRMVHVEKHIESLGITLPPAAAPRANYNIVCQASGNMLYVSGHLPFQADGTLMTGRIDGKERDVDYGYQAARWAGLNIVATLQEQLGDLDRIEKIVKVFGIVQSSDDFKSQHLVMDGCSDVLMEIFGKEVGYHARSAIGTSTLPLDISVEVEAVVQLKPE
ncbi:translation initiation inhibitor [Nitzschia inconspicua]|uniref:Translation initiation inhibitor n=1 Tax=Nitzschia inconspicua TaxID=303405 RepID=A0A9K3KL56_9STRA|nr:translation initiation inhibitor [Nitzschia inconspicua]